jgi:hypothetical protein
MIITLRILIQIRFTFASSSNTDFSNFILLLKSLSKVILWEFQKLCNFQIRFTFSSSSNISFLSIKKCTLGCICALKVRCKLVNLLKPGYSYYHQTYSQAEWKPFNSCMCMKNEITNMRFLPYIHVMFCEMHWYEIPRPSSILSLPHIHYTKSKKEVSYKHSKGHYTLSKSVEP